MHQQITIIGRVGRDPEMRYTPTGQAVTNFSVAASEKYTASSGEKVEKTVWFRISAWGKTAELCKQYIKKGMLVQVIGKMSGDEGGNPRVYTKQDGSSSASFEVTANNVLFLSKVEHTAQPDDEYPA
jgi:single-strand DNA-binding protein